MMVRGVKSLYDDMLVSSVAGVAISVHVDFFER